MSVKSVENSHSIEWLALCAVLPNLYIRDAVKAVESKTIGAVALLVNFMSCRVMAENGLLKTDQLTYAC